MTLSITCKCLWVQVHFSALVSFPNSRLLNPITQLSTLTFHVFKKQHLKFNVTQTAWQQALTLNSASCLFLISVYIPFFKSKFDYCCFYPLLPRWHQMSQQVFKVTLKSKRMGIPLSSSHLSGSLIRRYSTNRSLQHGT